MNTISFDRLLLETAFCCMASDGHIDTKEVTIIRSMCEKMPVFQNMDFKSEINNLVSRINANSKEFIRNYFSLLDNAELDVQEELLLIDFAIQTIQADEQIEYAEIKFFKNIRHRLKSSDETILNAYPDIEFFLEKDIVTESHLDKITRQFLDEMEIPVFGEITI